MNKWPHLDIKRKAEIFEEAISCRRIYCGDYDFFLMTDFWEDTCDEDGRWTIRTYKSDETEDYKRRAAVVLLGDILNLTVDERLLERARGGCLFSNFILAHEAGHVTLGHHQRNAKKMNFQLFADDRGMMCNLPPNAVELEANLAAVFFQCGVALLDSRWDARHLARRAFSDLTYVKLAQKLVQNQEFQRILLRPKPKYPRVVL